MRGWMRRVFGVAVVGCATAYGAAVIEVPPLVVPEGASQGADPGNWKAAVPPGALDYVRTEKAARDMEAAGKHAEALTLWERVLDRTTCTEEQRSKARARVAALRPKVKINTDPARARKWNVLALVYKEVNGERTEEDGSVTKIHQVFTEKDFAQIGKSLAGFRDLVFEWSSGVVLVDFDFVLVEEPITRIPQKKGFPLAPRDIVPEYKKASAGKAYDTVIAYVKHKGSEGPGLGRAWTAAMYGRIGELGDAGYMMVPWGPDYPYHGELCGEMELHEWLHQIDDLIHKNLGYPRGTSRSPDDGRTWNDSRTDGEQEYKRPKDCTTWTLFYKHLMTEHMTRQMWSELTINPNPNVKPGAVMKIAEGE
ncbi:MAG: hypothetical protein FWG50_06700 [Kiritimatiellaeota bacterium]|nr:hypothetical protein [Kiritimatiellota bacterium]